MKEEKINHLLVNKNTLKPQLVAKRQSGYKPKTRFEKLRMKDLIYPESSNQKIVFISNVQGNGFRRQKMQMYNIPSYINIQQMLKELNQVCYNQWVKSKNILQSDAFFQFQKLLNAFYILVIIIIICLFAQSVSMNILSLTVTVYISSTLFICSFVLALIIYNQNRIQHNPQAEMIRAIREKLAYYNKEEIKLYPQKQRFIWTCHYQCLWIAITIN